MPDASAHSSAVGAPLAGSPNSDDLVADRDGRVADVDDELVHRDAADDRAPCARQQHLGAAAGGVARNAVGVAERHECEGRRSVGVPEVAV